MSVHLYSSSSEKSAIFPDSSVGKKSTCYGGDPGSIPGLGRSPGEVIRYPIQYSGLENSMDCIVRGVAKSQTRQCLSLSLSHHLSPFKLYGLVTQLCPTLFDPMDYSLPGSSVHGILQARILEWVVMPSSRGSSQPRDQTQVFCITGRLSDSPGKPFPSKSTIQEFY